MGIYLEWNEPRTSKEAKKYLLTKGFVAAELYEAALAAKEKELERLKGHTWCAYCGEEFELDGDAEKIGIHIAVCSKHPMRHVEAELAELRGKAQSVLNTWDDVSIDRFPPHLLADALASLRAAVGR